MNEDALPLASLPTAPAQFTAQGFKKPQRSSAPSSSPAQATPASPESAKPKLASTSKRKPKENP